ncbi:MAG TPA: Pls/PosA family non-ribosomal peptide synthetase [Pseudonocardiaceae bacterium]|nr:Pls/PosA family non-ribosomal peptide synthetase [Pseudonocardiaceae bacterium]
MERSAEAATADLAESPTSQGSYARTTTGPATGTERILAEVLADVVRVERVPVDSDFFTDLGADSLVMARFCARVRKRADLPSVSMKDIYRNPTIRSLAAALADAAPIPAEPAPAESAPSAPIEAAALASRLRYILCAALQLLIFLGYTYLTALVITLGYEWISTGPGVIDMYLRSVLFGGASFFGLCLLPILAKWMLIGRWKPQRIRIWSLAYVRFWIARTLVRSNPLVLFVGSPLYVLYLRALGAKVGRGVAIFSRNVPVCTDLLTIGDGTVIRKDSFFTCYRAHAGEIQTGAVTLGKDVVVGEKTVLDINTSLGDGAQLGHASALHAGQAVPGGERWHGSPAQKTEADFQAVDPTGCGTLRRVVYTAVQLLIVLVVGLPLAAGGGIMLLAEVPQIAALLGPELAFTSWTFYRDALVASIVLFFGAVLTSLLLVIPIPRVLNLAIKPDKVYCLYGFHYWVHRVIARITNLRFFTHLLGDSSYIVYYLSRLGYNLYPVAQTGSNFGLEVKHDNPYLSRVGSGTIVADGLSIINADYSSTSFRVSRTSIGSRNFLGNYIAYPSQGKTGDNCLLATKVMVPIDGYVREGVGLLGSPSFEIPRSVQRDSNLDLNSPAELRRRLAAKNKHNALTIGLSLLAQWIFIFWATLLAAAAIDLYQSFGPLVIVLTSVLTVLFGIGYFVLVERAASAFRALQPRYCSIYEPYFWWHERYWKLSMQPPRILDGTPFRSLAWRLLGVQIGTRVFDDGCIIMEKTMVTIGDDCALNAGSIIQCHSQEDGAFKSDRITIGSGCAIGIGALVHYGVTMGEGSVLAPDSFLMKGEEIPQRARWGGNPAREIRDGFVRDDRGAA